MKAAVPSPGGRYRAALDVAGGHPQAEAVTDEGHAARVATHRRLGLAMIEEAHQEPSSSHGPPLTSTAYGRPVLWSVLNRGPGARLCSGSDRCRTAGPGGQSDAGHGGERRTGRGGRGGHAHAVRPDGRHRRVVPHRRPLRQGTRAPRPRRGADPGVPGRSRAASGGTWRSRRPCCRSTAARPSRRCGPRP